MSKKNKKVIKKDLEKSKFTTVHHSIMYDQRLSANAFRILISLLADAENFNASYRLFENRFKISNKTVKAAFKNLEECGYVKRTKLPRGFHYTISEFGNLNPTKTEVEEIPKVKETDVQLEEKIQKQQDLLLEYFDKNESYLAYDSIYNSLVDLASSYTDSSGLVDFYAFRNKAEKELKFIKKELLQGLMSFTNKRSACISKKADKQYKEWLKEEIYEKNNVPTDDECKNKWKYIKLRNQEFKTDYETAMQDKAEEDYYDNN